MKYPAEFSSEARAAVEAELIRAGRLHDERTRGYPDRHFRQHRSLETFILSVFLVYAREAIKLGTTGVWTVDQVRAQALKGLRLITIEITLKRNYPTFVDQDTWNILVAGKSVPCECASPEYIARQRQRGLFEPELTP